MVEPFGIDVTLCLGALFMNRLEYGKYREKG
jgi:hypothetical protein